MEFPEDDGIDGLMDEEAINEFANGMNFEIGEPDQEFINKLNHASATQAEKEVFAAMIVDDDVMMGKALFGANGKDDKVRTMDEAVDFLMKCPLAGKLIAEDKAIAK